MRRPTTSRANLEHKLIFFPAKATFRIFPHQQPSAAFFIDLCCCFVSFGFEVVAKSETMEIASFPIGYSIKSKLLKSGFTRATDLRGLSASNLVQQSGISGDEAAQLLALLGPSGAHDCVTTTHFKANSISGPTLPSSSGISAARIACATDLLASEACREHISIDDYGELDQLFGGEGIPVGELTEICGVPGIGKTQFCMQLSVNVNLPPSSGGLSATAVYIDAEGSLIPERLLSIADNVIKSHNLSEFLSVADILQNILIFRVHDFVEQLAVTCDFEKLISEHPTIKLIIVDSVAFHFRHEFDDASVRSKLLSMYAQRLSEIARTFKIAVVVINQVTMKVKGQSGTVVPALGETWAHNCAHRAMLQWQGQLRVASLVKSSRLPPAKAVFAISGHGIVRKEQGMPADSSAISE